MALCGVLATSAWAADAEACEPGYCVDAVAPAAGATGVASDGRVWVYYATTAGEEPEVSLVEDDTGQIVLTSVERFGGGGLEGDKVQERVARVEPFVGLLPGAAYRVALGPGGVCDTPTIRFRTGTASESPPLAFSGASVASVECLAEAETATDCNDGDVYPRLRVTVDADAPATDAAGYRLYRDGELLAVAPELPVTVDLLPTSVSGTECFALQAFNVAGVEDGNGTEVCVDMASATCGVDGGGGGGGGEDAGSAAPRDAGQTGTPGGEDAGSDGEDAGSGARTDSGGRAPEVGEADDGGCAQAASSSPSGGLMALLSLLSFALVVGRRRRR